mgnify:CR=1 FL=1
MPVVVKTEEYENTKKEAFNKFMEEVKCAEEKHALLFEKPEFKKAMDEAKACAEKLAKLIIARLPNAYVFSKNVSNVYNYTPPLNIKNPCSYYFSLTIEKCEETISLFERIHHCNSSGIEGSAYWWLQHDFGLQVVFSPKSPIKLSKENAPEYSDFSVSGYYTFDEDEKREWRIKHPESILKYRESK